jgi:hypothetical protein
LVASNYTIVSLTNDICVTLFAKENCKGRSEDFERGIKNLYDIGFPRPKSFKACTEEEYFDEANSKVEAQFFAFPNFKGLLD